MDISSKGDGGVGTFDMHQAIVKTFSFLEVI